MAADTYKDRYQKIGENPVPSTTDTLSSTPIGSAAVPVDDARLAWYPVAPGSFVKP